MKVKRLGIMCYSDDFMGPGAWFGYILKHVSHRILPERVFPLTASDAVSVFHVLPPRTEFLHADEIRNE